MQSHQLVEFAANLAISAQTIVFHNRAISDESLQRYWVASRCRLQNWLGDFKRYEQQLHSRPDTAAQTWNKLQGLVLEVIHAEILARVWAAILNGIDQVCGVKDCDCVGRGVLMGQLEARHRVLQLLLKCKGPPARLMGQNLAKAERWTDLLIGLVNQHVDVSGYGCCDWRVAEFSEDLEKEIANVGHFVVSAIIAATIRNSYAGQPASEHGYSQQNQQVVAAIMDAFTPNIYSGVGKLYSANEAQLLISTSETLGAIDGLFRADSDSPDPGGQSPSNR